MSNIEKFLGLLASAHAVTVDDGAMLKSWETSEVTGQPDNQVVRFSWTDGECNYADVLDEQGIAKGVFHKDGSFVAENIDGERSVIRFFEVTQLTAPNSGLKAANQFMTELLASKEVLSAIAELYGARTLADLIYLHTAIMSGGFIDHYPRESNVLEIVQDLPSGKQWATFIKIERLDQAVYARIAEMTLSEITVILVEIGVECEGVSCDQLRDTLTRKAEAGEVFVAPF